MTAARCGLAATAMLALVASQASATEYGFSTYGLGSTAFGAGSTPPPGIYLTEATAFYSARIGRSINFGNVTLNAGAKVEGFSAATNALYVPERKLFGGNLGFAITIPVGHVDLEATIGIGLLGASREVAGWGLGDTTGKVQLGWQHGEFAHTFYVQAVAPTGRWDPGFSPIIGLHRPGIDTGWAFTWTDKAKKLQLNGTGGFTFNFENTATDYRSGNEFHWEWAAGFELVPGLVAGVVGYDYRQVTADSGTGATLGALKGRVDAIGPGLSYTTLIGSTPFILNARRYQEFNVQNRWDGTTTFISGTLRF